MKFSDVDKHAYRFVEHHSHEEYTDDQGAEKHKSVLYVQLSAEKTGTVRRGYPYIKTEVRSGVDGNGLSIETEIRFAGLQNDEPLKQMIKDRFGIPINKL